MGKFHIATAKSPDIYHCSRVKIRAASSKRQRYTQSVCESGLLRFHLHQIAQAFPETAETLLLDTYLTDEAAASSRVFRVYRPTPPHYHAHSDEYLYVLSGRGTFWMGDASNGGEFSPGDLLVFKRRIVHSLPRILEE